MHAGSHVLREPGTLLDVGYVLMFHGHGGPRDLKMC